MRASRPIFRPAHSIPLLLPLVCLITCRCVKALDRHAAHLCVLAKDCDSEEFTTLVMALCKEADIPLLFAATREELGELVGLAKTDKEGNIKGKIQKCSVAVVTEWGEESRELHKLKEYLNK